MFSDRIKKVEGTGGGSMFGLQLTLPLPASSLMVCLPPPPPRYIVPIFVCPSPSTMWPMVLIVEYYPRDNELKANSRKRKALMGFRSIEYTTDNNVTHIIYHRCK